MNGALANFEILRPDYEVSQEEALEWIANAHSKAESEKNGWDQEHQELKEFHQNLKERIFKIGAGPGKVQKRGIQFRDVFHSDWDAMEIYQLQKHPEGADHGHRIAFYDRVATGILEQFYPEGSLLPKHLIHVTCTGYSAPSAAQKIVSKRDCGSKTIVTHAYHMGCYGSISAIRIGLGFFHTPSPALPFPPIDIVHTEICSIHMNPSLHRTDQLVMQTLFGDGYIKYSLVSEQEAGQSKDAHLKILSLHEETIPESLHCMSWQCEHWGMGMSLAREVPVLIGRSLNSFLNHLIEQAGLDSKELCENSFFAIHPGGPKIIDQIADLLHLKPNQIQYSQHILREYGNMSSATLPHVWQQILDDPSVPSGAKIISLAFGPGLSVSGGLFEKATSKAG